MNWTEAMKGLSDSSRPPRDLAMRLIKLAGASGSLAYAGALGVRAFAYQRFDRLSRSVPRPVVSVGNLTFGGTGKTPAVEWLCRELLSWGKRPLIVSRGYGRGRAQQNEEALLLTEALPSVPHLQGANRFKMAAQGIEQYKPDCIVLDDGFQHWALRRDLDLVLVDALDPFGGGKLPPLGRLREPLSALRRAGGVIVTRSDMAPARELDRILNTVAYYARAPIALAVHRPVDLCTPTGEPVKGAAEMKGVRAFLVSGIGNPQGFHRSVEQLGAVLCGHRIFSDHYRYRSRDLDRVRAEARRASADVLVTTEKDAVKIRFLPEADGLPVWVLRIRFELSGGQSADLVARIRKTVGADRLK